MQGKGKTAALWQVVPDVDFPAVAKAIADIGYDDYITLEMLPNYKQFPEVSLYADKYAMDRIAGLVENARGSR